MEQFIKDLLKEKGLPANLEPAVYDRLVKDLSERVEKIVNKRLIDSLSDEQFDQLEKLSASSPNEQAVQDFINANVPNKDKIVALALAEFRQLYLGNAPAQ